jgi:hypothetical protein
LIRGFDLDGSDGLVYVNRDAKLDSSAALGFGMTRFGRFVMGWAQIDRPRAHYAQDTGQAVVLTTFRIVTGRGSCGSEDARFGRARGSRYRNDSFACGHLERDRLRPARLTALNY